MSRVVVVVMVVMVVVVLWTRRWVEGVVELPGELRRQGHMWW